MTIIITAFNLKILSLHIFPALSYFCFLKYLMCVLSIGVSMFVYSRASGARVCVYCLEAAIQIAIVNLKTRSMMGLTKSTTEKSSKTDTTTLRYKHTVIHTKSTVTCQQTEQQSIKQQSNVMQC